MLPGTPLTAGRASAGLRKLSRHVRSWRGRYVSGTMVLMCDGRNSGTMANNCVKRASGRPSDSDKWIPPPRNFLYFTSHYTFTSEAVIELAPIRVAVRWTVFFFSEQFGAILFWSVNFFVDLAIFIGHRERIIITEMCAAFSNH